MPAAQAVPANTEARSASLTGTASLVAI